MTLALQAIAAILPVGSAAASVVIGTLLPEINKDRIAWFEYLANTVRQHEERLGRQEERQGEWLENKIGEFAQRPEFRAAVLRTTEVALRDPLRKKWKTLSNIVLQNALPNPPDDDLQLMFLDCIATFGSWHLALLTFFDTPRAWPIDIEAMPSGQSGTFKRSVVPFKVIELAIPELAEKQAFCMQCIADLVSRGLIALDANELEFTGLPYPLSLDALAGTGLHAPTARLTTILGRQFLQLTADTKFTSHAADESRTAANFDKPNPVDPNEDESRIVTAINWARQFPSIPQNLSTTGATIHPRTIAQQVPEGGSDEMLTYTVQEWTVVLGGQWAVDLDSGGAPNGPPWQI